MLEISNQRCSFSSDSNQWLQQHELVCCYCERSIWVEYTAPFSLLKNRETHHQIKQLLKDATNAEILAVREAIQLFKALSGSQLRFHRKSKASSSSLTFLIEVQSTGRDCLPVSKRMSNHQYQFTKHSTGNLRRVKELLHKSDNRTCADCGAADPKWASANIGVFICLKCCGVHRSLGTHISKVLSVTLDEWSDEEVDNMIEVGGNSSANAIYEAHLPEGSVKPSPDSSHEERMHFIRSKYELQEFLKPSLRIVSLSSARNSIYSSDSGNNLNSFRVSNKSKVAMVEFIGLLKVKVIEGRNLAVRDFRSSDPYVVVSIGQQKAQTTVMKSNLNPVWKEDLMLSVPQNYGALKLQVFDHDTFSADDIMGEAEVDIQPLVTAATAFIDVSMFGNMQIGKWLKTSDNALIRDSIINIIDGMVKQEVSLKLQNVESGELEIELEWLPLEQ
ncbi:hypothetical protein AAC387_Pa05g3548 [Persea americana]